MTASAPFNPSQPPALTVYFDGACPVCSREIAMYRRQPGAELWRTLPRWAWQGRIAGSGPMPALLDAGYRGFLVLRSRWRSPAPAAPMQGP